MSRLMSGLVVVTCMFIALPVLAQNSATKADNKLKDYFSSIAQQVKKEQDPAQKRAILNRGFEKVFNVADRIEKMPSFSSSDLQVISELRSRTQDKFDELNGLNGYEPVGDAQLDNFANYVVQDMEQAKSVTIVTSTAVLIVLAILIILLI